MFDYRLMDSHKWPVYDTCFGFMSLQNCLRTAKSVNKAITNWPANKTKQNKKWKKKLIKHYDDDVPAYFHCNFKWHVVCRQRGKVVPQLYSCTHISLQLLLSVGILSILCSLGGKQWLPVKDWAWNNTAAFHVVCPLTFAGVQAWQSKIPAILAFSF